MIWNEIDGNLVKLAKAGKFDLIAHGCNCKKNMGAGIAKQIKAAFPLVYEIDKASHSKFGDISVCEDYPECIVINAYTQVYPGPNGNGRVSCMPYHALKKAYGLAGLKWNKVKTILKEELINMNVTIVHFKK